MPKSSGMKSPTSSACPAAIWRSTRSRYWLPPRSLSLSQIEPAAGRGVRRTLEVANGEATLIDESYNANPASMAAALSVLGAAAVGPHGRRIAVLGDMLELGPTGAQLHRGLN